MVVASRLKPNLIANDFVENVASIPPEELKRYWNQHVAISLDGRRILKAASTWELLERELTAEGIDPSQVVFDFIDNPDVIQTSESLLFGSSSDVGQ